MKWMLFLFFLVSSAHAGKIAVVKLIGSAVHAGKFLKAGEIFEATGPITTDEKSYLRLRLIETDDRLSMGPSSSLEMAAVADSPPTLLAGAIRWVTGPAKIKRGTAIKTKEVTFGIRGTDFYASYLPLLGETEIICFDGAVDFKEAKSGEGPLVTKNQWGGHGGRFGAKIAQPLDLPPAVIGHFKGLIPSE